MHWIAPSEKNIPGATLEKRLWDLAERAMPAPIVAEVERRMSVVEKSEAVERIHVVEEQRR